jgi:hypothetical protein
MKHTLTIGLAVLLLAATLLVPAAALAAAVTAPQLADAVVAPQLVAARAVPVAADSTVQGACSLGRTVNDVFSSDTDNPLVLDPVYVFPASGGTLDLVSSVFDWPGGELVQDFAFFVAGRERPILVRWRHGIIPAGDWYLIVTFSYPAVPAGTRVEWAHRVAACEPDPVGYPDRGRVPPLPVFFQ